MQRKYTGGDKMDEKEIKAAEVEEVKEAIKFIGEYCSSCYVCDDCDNEIRKWCNGIKNNPPEEWDEVIR